MTNGIKIKKGLYLPLEGGITDALTYTKVPVGRAAIIPDDFIGIIPRPEVHEGDTVLAGAPLYHSKDDERIKVVSPLNGVVKGIVRGERRKILRFEIEKTGDEPQHFNVADAMSSPEKARELLLQSGLWALMRQRPYDIVPAADAKFRDIFVTCFDSAPLASNRVELSETEKRMIQKGIDLLKLLTDGKIYLGKRPEQFLSGITNAELINLTGPHPAGNVGTLIGLTKPVNKGETVLCLHIAVLFRIGYLLENGYLSNVTHVAVTGSEIEKPCMIQTVIGAPIADILNGHLKKADHHIRIISGNVLTGKKVDMDGYLRLPYDHITVIPEGDDVDEFMGWASLSSDKLSTNPTFPGAMKLKRLFNPDARLNGGRRAMIMSGQYDKVIPLDIMPEYLIKAILARDIDRMEQLGIYEVAPEDFALAEYVDTSKLELQKIVREGLDYLRKELE